MEKCLSVGAKTYNQLAACHVAGWGGWNKRLNRQAERYKQKYIRMAQASKVPSWAGTLSAW
jgi:DNA-binding transcriptional MocR family regulator